MLGRRWIHAHEDDDGNKIVYRTSGYDFPRTRQGRDTFTLNRGGIAVVGSPGPVDREESVEGRWVLEGRTLRIETGSESRVYEIASVEEEVLILKAAEPEAAQPERLNRKER
jgi:hypothetical protein